MNAVDFIKQSVLYTSAKYTDLRSLVDKVVTNQLTEADLDSFVDVVAPLETVEDGGNRVEPSSAVVSASAVRPEGPVPTKIKAIRRISEMRNVALIKQTAPIELADGLNIFYGHNGDGKTTLYRAIANCLGLSDHSLNNVDGDAAQPPQVRLVVEDVEGESLDLTWPTEDCVSLHPLRVFDAKVCLSR